MKKIVIILCLSLSLTACSGDPNGWDRAKWGQSINEVKLTYKDIDSKEKDVKGQPNLKILELEQTKIEEIPLDVTLLFVDNQLSETLLRYTPEASDKVRSPASVMKNLQTILTYSYGEFDKKIENSKESGLYELLWFEGKTTITLTYLSISGVTVKYEKVKESIKP